MKKKYIIIFVVLITLFGFISIINYFEYDWDAVKDNKYLKIKNGKLDVYKKYDDYMYFYTNSKENILKRKYYFKSTFSKNNISDSKQNVKSDTKYSMQNVGKNEQDIGNNSFNKNIKRYNDLLKTNYIEYFRKDNGDVRVNLIGSNNNLVNQLDLVTTTDAIKQLF